jgi:hypothetical protein
MDPYIQAAIEHGERVASQVAIMKEMMAGKKEKLEELLLRSGQAC